MPDERESLTEQPEGLGSEAGSVRDEPASPADGAAESIEAADVSPELEPEPVDPPVADDVLLASAALAQRALLEMTAPETVGSVIGHVVEGEHVLTLLFAADVAGYRGWHWAVTIARVEGAEPTVLETELMPGDGALLAPEWVPWSDRLADYRAAQAAAAAEAAADGGDASADSGDGVTDASGAELDDDDEFDDDDLDDDLDGDVELDDADEDDEDDEDDESDEDDEDDESDEDDEGDDESDDDEGDDESDDDDHDDDDDDESDDDESDDDDDDDESDDDELDDETDADAR